MTNINVKNILLIGRTGSGKSTLANVLINEGENFEKGGKFEEVFKESDSSVPETKNTESKEVEINGVKYCVIDTIGIGNTKLSEEKIVREIFEVCCKFEGGLTQILFVINKRVTLEEIKIYNIVRKRIFDKSEKDIAKYTTIVRTDFHRFRIEKECDKDYESLKKENKKITKLIKLINPEKYEKHVKIIYVDNPSLSSDYNEEEVFAHKKRREDSRNVVLNFLSFLPILEDSQDVYRSRSLELINEAFNKYVSGDKESRDRFMRFLSKEKEKYEKQGSLRRWTKRKAEEIFKKKPETEKDMTELSLQAAIEIRDNCKQM